MASDRRDDDRTAHPGEERRGVMPAHPIRAEHRHMSRPARYEIEIRGRATDRVLRPVIDDFRIEPTDVGTTCLIGEIHDASQLNGLLAHLTSMNVEVVGLRRLDPPRSGPAHAHQPPPPSTQGKGNQP